MQIDITRWECEGLRCPDITVDLMHEGEPAQIALIQMPNGTGKTTTLNMLTATLTGTATQWRPEYIRELRRPTEDNERGRFCVDLRADGTPITFELTLDFVEGHAQYRTTTPATGGMIPRWEPPPGLQRFLTPEFLQLFVFDGEYAERLLSQGYNEAERAIDALCQVYLLDEVAAFAKEDWERAVRGGGPTTSSGLNMALNKLTHIRGRIRTVTQAQEKARRELNNLSTQITDLDAKIRNHISHETGLRDQYERAQSDNVQAQIDLENVLNEMMRQMRYPNALHSTFAEALISLKQSLDRLKLPETTSRQFFVELAEEAECICGRPLDEQSRNEILSRSELYLGQEEAGSINALKKDIETHCGNNAAGVAQQLEEATANMVNAMQTHQQAEQKVRSLQQSLIDSGDATLAEWQEEKIKLESQKTELEELLNDIEREPFDNEDPDRTYCLKGLHALEQETEQKVTKITGTLTLKEQTDVIRIIAEKAKGFARSDIRKALLTACNEMLMKVLGNDPLQLDAIEQSLVIRHQKSASVGQTLAVGYTFLMSLLNRGNNQFPLVVDSPCGSLDDGRREAIGGLIPELCTQFISFVIPTERASFVPAIERSKKGAIKYLTVFRNTPEAEVLRSHLPSDGVLTTTNGVLVEGRDYFNEFTA